MLASAIQATFPDKDDHKPILNSLRAPNDAKERHFSYQQIRNRDFSALFILAPQAAARPALPLVRPWVH